MNQYVFSTLATLTLLFVAFTRIPPTGIEFALVLLALGFGITAAWMSLRGPRDWIPPAYIVSVVTLLALPGPATPWLDVPPVITAFIAIAMLSAFFQWHQEKAPWIGPKPTTWVRIRGVLPVAVVLVAVALATFIMARFLPDRLASSHELLGVPGLLLLGFILLVAPWSVAAIRGLMTKEADA